MERPAAARAVAPHNAAPGRRRRVASDTTADAAWRQLLDRECSSQSGTARMAHAAGQHRARRASPLADMDDSATPLERRGGAPGNGTLRALTTAHCAFLDGDGGRHRDATVFRHRGDVAAV